MKKYVLCLVLFLGLFLSCTKRNDDFCDRVQFCTEIFVTIGAQVVDNKGATIKLDRVESILTETSEILLSDFPDGFYDFYPIVNDLALKKLKRTGSEIQFSGWARGKKLFEEMYIIGHDCCHVVKISGKDRIVVK